MKLPTPDRLRTGRLILIPFTMPLCRNLLAGNYSDLTTMGLARGKSWPDEDMLETLPRILHNLLRVDAPTGFESWMIVKEDSKEVIGDLGFKGFNQEEGSADISYGIIKEERRNGYAEEAAAALIQWAFAQEGLQEITARCLSDNAGSAHLLTKFGFQALRQEEEKIFWSLPRKGSVVYRRAAIKKGPLFSEQQPFPLLTFYRNFFYSSQMLTLNLWLLRS